MRALLSLTLIAACSAPLSSAAQASTAQQHPVGVLETLRLGMRRGLGPGPRPSTPEEVEEAIAPARCAPRRWTRVEAGVRRATCVAALPIGRTTFTFERYTLPGEPTQPGLLNIEVAGPLISEPTVAAWVEDRSRELTAAHGPPSTTAGPPSVVGVEHRWQTPARSILLSRQGVCGGLCIAKLWIAGPGHPDLARRGF